MGLFESVQLELFELMGFKKAPQITPKKTSKSPNLPENSTDYSLKTPDNFSKPSCAVEIIRKKNLRGLRFRVTAKAVLEISANKSSSEGEIFSLLLPHHDWIEKQVDEAKKRHEVYPQKKWQSGEVFQWNGKDIELVFSPSSTKKAHIRFMENSFEYFYPISWHELSQKDVHEKLHANFLYFFKLKASETLGAKVDFWSKEMGLFPKSVSYRNQKTRWGSCSSDGRVNLNWKLSVFTSEIQDYVIIHELAHLKHQDHSKNFWKLVEQFCPNRKKISNDLHKSAFGADPFAAQSELYQNNPSLPEGEL